MRRFTRRDFSAACLGGGLFLAAGRNLSAQDADAEKMAWAKQKATAEAAFAFWNKFLGLRQGKMNDKALDNAYIEHWHCIIRAVSWVESRHGTGSGASAKLDPMQAGNPGDIWWKSLTGTADKDRFVRGPGLTPNYWARELPAAAAAETDFAADAKLSKLNDKTKGHNDPKFNATMSYYWGIAYLIQRVNTQTSCGRTYMCFTYSRGRLIDGAARYNAGGDPGYKDKLVAAVDNTLDCDFP